MEIEKVGKDSNNFSDTKPHYELLDGLRGIAALFVVWYHVFEGLAFAEIQNSAGDGLIRILNHGYLAVDFFFMLSGFVISYAYDDRWGKLNLRIFFRRRLIRLHPMVMMGAAIGAVAFIVGGCQQWSGETVSINWLLVALCLAICMIPIFPSTYPEVRGNGEMFPLNGPSWSLFFEYIGNILYAVVLRRLSTHFLILLVGVLAVVFAWFCVFNISDYGCIGVGWTLDGVNFGGGLLRMLFPFTLGMVLARKFKPIKVRWALGICSFLLLLLFIVPYIPGEGRLCYNGIYEFCCVAIVFPAIVWLGASGKATDNYTHRINQFLGELSYPLYMVHYPVMYLFYAWLIKHGYYTLEAVGWLAVGVVCFNVLLAWVCCKYYDRPMRRWLLHFGNQK